MKLNKKTIIMIFLAFVIFFIGVVLLFVGCLSSNEILTYISLILIALAIVLSFIAICNLYKLYKESKHNE